MKYCKYCQKEFIPNFPTRLFCSEKCKWSHENALKFKRIAEKKSKIKVVDLPNEIWKDIKDFEGLFMVSNLGRVKRLYIYKPIKRKDIIVNMCKEETLLKGSLGMYGYIKFSLVKDNKLSTIYLHKLIATAFIHNPNNLYTVNHIDGNKLNNSINNLEWLSLSDNVKHAWENGLNKPYKRIKGVKGVRNKLANPIYDSPDCYARAKRVICTKTGKIWGSAKSAAIDLDLRPQTLVRYLNGGRKNPTSLIYDTTKPNPAPSI